MGGANNDNVLPFAKSDLAAAAIITRTEYGNLHMGLVYKTEDASERCGFLHLGWHDKLFNQWEWKYFWATCEQDPIFLEVVGAYCRLILRRFEEDKRFPYGLYLRDTTFDSTGRLKLGQEAVGLTCASFVISVFGCAKINLVDQSSWPHRQAEDSRFVMERLGSFSTPGQLDALQTEVRAGGIRFLPEEVMGSFACSFPASFSAAVEAGQAVVQAVDQLGA